jgi:hypothetical protein
MLHSHALSHLFCRRQSYIVFLPSHISYTFSVAFYLYLRAILLIITMPPKRAAITSSTPRKRVRKVAITDDEMELLYEFKSWGGDYHDS